MVDRKGTLGIGERLRNAREARGLTLDVAFQQTRIRVAYLQALEDEEFTRLPGPVYAKGFLRAYADVLGLNSDELVAVYPEAFAAPRPSLVGRPAEIPIRPVAPPSRLRRVLMYVATGVVVIAGVLGYIGYQGWRAFNAVPEFPPAAPALAPSPFEDAPMAAIPRPAPETPAASPLPEAVISPAAATVSLTVRAGGTTWVRVTSDGRRVFEGFLHAGDARTWSALRQITIRLGNAPVAEVEVNGRRIYTPAGLRVWQRTFEARRH